MLIALSCSTEKNTWVTRNYHGLTAHYNGYFNANQLIDQSMTAFLASREDNFYEVLTIDPIPDKDEVIGMYPALDTAIAKCKKVIRNHSMPSNDRPARKKDEHNAWIDENWTTIGIAMYYRRDYEGAMKSFEYVRKFYSNDPSLYIGELWMAKTNIEQGELTKAKFHLDNLDKAIALEEEGNDSESKSKSKSKKKKSKFSKKYGKKKKKKDKEDEVAKFPKSIRFELEKTKAHLALLRDDKENAIKYLEESLKQAQMGDNKSRVHFILGQLYAETGDDQKAEEHYSSVVKGKAPFQMSFNARMQRALLGSGEKTRKELNKMLRDGKNAEYKDQIYYALAKMEFKEGNEDKGVENLTLCAFYSTKNTRQKGMAYEDLGDLRFSKRDYVNAQKYYDSCANVIDDKYPDAEAVRNKAINLESLVKAVETAHYEDSVQRIAAMDVDTREKFLKDLIKQIKEEEERRKKREAERLLELQQNENLFAQSGSGGKWYWNNAKTRSEGYEEFKRLWGTRENEDDWRRSQKTTMAEVGEVGEEAPLDSIPQEPEDTLTVENLMRWIPLTDSALEASNTRLLAAYYAAGIIYKDQLSEPQMAQEQFEAVIAKKVENPHILLSAYQLYKIHESGDKNKAAFYKTFILNNYPNSDYANYLRDPDYFIKKKEREALAEQEYVRVLERYEKGLFYPVMTKADQVINDEKDNIYRSKYLILKALCLGKISDNKQDMVPYLEMAIADYPETPEAQKAKEMLNIIKNGYSENKPYDFSNKSPFTYDDRAKLKVIVFLDEKTTSNSARNSIANFHQEFFSRDRLKVSSKIFGKDQSVILIDEFDTDSDAAEYIRVYKRTRKHLLDLQNAKIMMITGANLKVLFQKQNLAEYEKFYEEYY